MHKIWSGYSVIIYNDRVILIPIAQPVLYEASAVDLLRNTPLPKEERRRIIPFVTTYYNFPAVLQSQYIDEEDRLQLLDNPGLYPRMVCEMCILGYRSMRKLRSRCRKIGAGKNKGIKSCHGCPSRQIRINRRYPLFDDRRYKYYRKP